MRKGEAAPCGTRMGARRVMGSERIPCASGSTLPQPADWTLEADKVLAF